MKRIFPLLALLTALTVCPPIYGWGQKGHDVVAAIAERNLTKKAKVRLNEILGGKSLVYYATWMDDLQNSPYWKDGYDVTKTWHYFDVDEGYTVETMPRNEKGDVISAVEMISKRLRDDRNLTDSMRLDHTRMLIHLVGDMHCPMHAGHLSDIAGNSIKVKWFGQPTNLHSVWDSKLIGSAHQWSYIEWVDQMDRCTRKERKAMTEGNFTDWFAETVALCPAIYADSPANSNLSYQYVHDHAPVVERQLLLAGYRLAALLNEIFG